MLSQVLWNSPRSLPVAMAVAVLTVVVVTWLYPPQVKGLGWGWRLTLPLLRAAGMLALAAALLRPALLRPKTADERGTVIVLLDRSRSMSVVDNLRTPAQLVSLADALGTLPAGARSAATSAIASRAAEVRALLAAAERAWGELQYASVAGRGVEAARARTDAAARRLHDAAADLTRAGAAHPDAALRERLAALGELPLADEAGAGAALAGFRARLDAVESTAAQVQAAADEHAYRTDARVRAACDAFSRLSRYDLAVKALHAPGAGLLAGLGEGAAVEGFAFAAGLSPLPLRAPSPAPSSAPATGPAPPHTTPSFPEPTGRRSDIAASVQTVLDRYAAREVAAVVLLSDGRQTGGERSVASGLSASGPPLYVVNAAPPAALKDLSLAAPHAPAGAFVGESVTVRAELRPHGLRDGEAQVRLSIEGGAEQAQTVRFTEGRPAEVEFRLKPEHPGPQLITLSVPPADGEATAENNTARRWLKVPSQKVKVAAYALPGWDFQYLRNALARAPWVALEAGVLSPAAPRLPLSPEQILRQDVLILSDVPVSALDDAQWSAAYRLVAERGGSVVLLAGPAHVPGDYAQHFVASSLLPYAPDVTPTWRMWPGEEPMFRLVPHPEAASEPPVQLGPATAGGAGAGLSQFQRWQMLSGFYRLLPLGRLKPGASALLVEASTGESVVAQNRVGSGRAFLVGANETWRWRAGGGEDMHERFWLQLVRHAAGEPYAAVSERLGLDLDRISMDVGEVVRAKARDFLGGDPARLRLEVVRDGQPPRAIALATGPDLQQGRLAASVGPLPEGDYQVKLYEADVPQGAVSLPLHVTAGYEAELADVTPDAPALARLADASGGAVYRLEDLPRLVERLRTAARQRSRYVEQRLWDSPYLFVLVVACFTAEWAARKRLGLA